MDRFSSYCACFVPVPGAWGCLTQAGTAWVSGLSPLRDCQLREGGNLGLLWLLLLLQGPVCCLHRQGPRKCLDMGLERGFGEAACHGLSP